MQVSEDAATALERALVRRDAVLLRAGTVEVEPSFTFVRRETDGSSVQGQDGGERRRNDVTGGLALRLGLPLASQVTISLPYEWVETSALSRTASDETRDQTRSAAGVGDLSIRLAKQLLREGGGWRPDLVLAATWDTRTGQREHGGPLGSGFDEVTAELTASTSQDPLVFVGSLSYRHTFAEGGDEPGDVYGVSLGTVLAASPETSLRLFLDQDFSERDRLGGRGVPGSDRVRSVFSVGASSLVWRHLLLDAELGIGLTEDAPDYAFRVALPIRFELFPSFRGASR